MRVELWPPKDKQTKNQRKLRGMDRVLTEVLEYMRLAIFKEVGEPLLERDHVAEVPKVSARSKSLPKDESGQSTDIDDVISAYRLILGRNPDKEGLEHYRELIKKEISAKALCRHFILRSRDWKVSSEHFPSERNLCTGF